MSSFFRYPGGKAKLRDQIVRTLVVQGAGRDLQYREPFFGGGSIGLKLIQNNPHIKNVWINDKDIGIACLWTSVIRYVDEFKARVKSFTPSVAAFHQFKTELPSLTAMPTSKDEIVDVGFKKLAIHQISYSGLGTKSGGPLGGDGQKSKYKIDCRWSPKYICNKAEKLHVLFSDRTVYTNGCTNLDFGDVIAPKSPDALIYLDPPYYVKGNDLYQHGFTEGDHQRLADLLKNSGHAWLLSYDDCPAIRGMYSWSAFHSLTVKYSITATKDGAKRLSTAKPELLIYPQDKDLSNAYGDPKEVAGVFDG